MSFFTSIEKAEDDPILSLQGDFLKDSREKKVNLGIGAYKNNDGLPHVLTCVKKAEEIILSQNLNKEYLPMLGNPSYIDEALKLIYGENSQKLLEKKIFGSQSIGGTGALNLGADFLVKNGICRTIYLSNPTWPNHHTVFSFAGMKIEQYNYYDEKEKKFNFSAMVDSINSMPESAAILFQPCCHNPTGFDPSFDQWLEISKLVKKRKIIPFFDLAYLGFGDSIIEDAKVIRQFADDGHEMLVAFSFSKNFGLYGERVGLLSFVTEDENRASILASQVKIIIRANYSMPPLQGSRIVSTILQQENLRNEWIEELTGMKNRITDMRNALSKGLNNLTRDKDFNYISKQKGMFSFSGLNSELVASLQSDFGIYMAKNGRLNVAGLNPGNLDYVIESIASVVL